MAFVKQILKISCFERQVIPKTNEINAFVVLRMRFYSQSASYKALKYVFSMKKPCTFYIEKASKNRLVKLFF